MTTVDLTAVFAWLIIGAVAGWFASVIVKTRSGILTDVIVGIIGAFIGGLMFTAVGTPDAGNFTLWTMVVAVVGAIVLLALLRMVSPPEILA
jgi:uncharacterized membrane protein YeaQ/YmgE (transglycosylase-associated protein family)